MKILEIIEGYVPAEGDHDYYDSGEGVLIKTDDGDIKIAIYGTQCCCEHFGYNLLLPNGLKAEDFIGEDVLSIFIINEMPSNLDSYAFEEGVTYGVTTYKGVIVLNVFNSHNGYYGHYYSFTAKGISDKGTL